jgi:hypothetical protein
MLSASTSPDEPPNFGGKLSEARPWMRSWSVELV